MTTEPENTDSPASKQETPAADNVVGFEQDDQGMQALKLGDEFDSALIGATIRGEFAYSLTQLTIIAMNQQNMTADAAQQFVAQQVMAVTRAHGAAAPVFVDDWLLAEKTAQAQKEAAALREIAIPGQNHGAVKGFLNPNGVRSN